jgi:hypothetical protein
MTIWPPVLAAAVAAAAALVGYWLTYVSKQRASKTEIYAKALATVEAYKQLPYRIRRRAESSSAVRRELGKAISDVQQDIAFYRRFLRLDSVAVGIAFDDLVDKVYEHGSEFRAQAWKVPPAAADEEMDFETAFDYEDDDEQRQCLLAMRKELRTRLR